MKPKKGWWYHRAHIKDSGIIPKSGWYDIDGKHCLFCGSTNLADDYGPYICKDCGFENVWGSDVKRFNIEESAKYSCMVAMLVWDINERRKYSPACIKLGRFPKEEETNED